MTAPKVGDRVHVEYDGTVMSSGECSAWIQPDGPVAFQVYAAHDLIAVLPPLDPEYVVGSWYVDARNRVFLRGSGTWVPANGRHLYPTRPLTRLVPESAS